MYWSSSIYHFHSGGRTQYHSTRKGLSCPLQHQEDQLKNITTRINVKLISSIYLYDQLFQRGGPFLKLSYTGTYLLNEKVIGLKYCELYLHTTFQWGRPFLYYDTTVKHLKVWILHTCIMMCMYNTWFKPLFNNDNNQFLSCLYSIDQQY